MKVQYLHIRNYKQFSDLELDLTYPKGHEKAGQPLDKICIIGQSGTGKTNLLDIIKKSTIDFSEQPKNDYLPFFAFIGKGTVDRYITSKFIFNDKYIAQTLFTKSKSSIEINKKEKFTINEKIYFLGIEEKKEFLVEEKILKKEMSELDRDFLKQLNDTKRTLVYDTVHKKQDFGTLAILGREKSMLGKLKEIDTAIQQVEQKYISIKKNIKELKSNNFYDSNIIDLRNVYSWSFLKDKIDNYEQNRLEYISLLSNRLLAVENYEKKNYKQDLKIWENKNENLLEKIAEDINFILRKFNLELTKIDENQQNYNGLTIKDLSNDTIIEYDDLSTGTKNLLSTFIPLKTYAPTDSIILIDEPEMSFYPDIQRQLTELYTTVGENNQLIVATHSPLIASSFEPWEVVELKFDKNNQICREPYYPKEEENHVDNYVIDPRYLTWTSILTDVFDLKEDSNFSFREKGLMEYASLKVEIKALKDKESKEAKEKIEKFKKLSQKLGLQN